MTSLKGQALSKWTCYMNLCMRKREGPPDYITDVAVRRFQMPLLHISGGYTSVIWKLLGVGGIKND